MPEFKNPSATVDLIVVRENWRNLGFVYEILLIKRKHPPFEGRWALPGGHLDYGKENLEEAAVRELQEETHLVTDKKNLRLIGNYSDPDRDPRGHVISHAYLVGNYSGIPKADDDAAEFGWFKISELPSLAFDHRKILEDFVKEFGKGGTWH